MCSRFFGSIATVSTTAAVTTRHPQCPVVTPVGTAGTNTVAVAAKADGRSMPSAVLTPQRPFVTGASSSKHQSQHVGSEETKYDNIFLSSLRHYQSAVLDVSSCSTRFPSTRVRILDVLEGDNIELQLTIDSAKDIPYIPKTFIHNHEKLRYQRILSIPPGAVSPYSADGSAISPRTASAITHNDSESQSRIDLTAALDESFKNSTFNVQHKTQLLDLCTQYRSVFSLTQEELRGCTIAEAEFPLQKTLNQWIVTSIGQIQEHKK